MQALTWKTQSNSSLKVYTQYSFMHMTADRRIFPKLKVLIQRDTGKAQLHNAKCGEGSDVSGMVVESPQKTILTDSFLVNLWSWTGLYLLDWKGWSG